MKRRFPHRTLAACCLFLAPPAIADPSLGVRLEGGGLVLEVGGDPTRVQRVEFGDGLVPWAPFDVRGGETAWEAVGEMPVARRLFRVVESVPPAIAPHRSWKGRVELPDDPLLSADPGESFEIVRWVKFAILLDDLRTVYFQSSSDYPFHYNFASERLAPFAGMTTGQFDAVSLHRSGQQVVLGAVLVAPFSQEFAVQLVGLDPYPREMARFLYQTVESKLDRGAGWRGFYMPTAAHSAATRADAAYFEAHAIDLAEPDRWSGAGGCYVGGWALGRLRYVPHDQIDAAYRSGELLPTDILLTDLVPAELPFVAGILTMAPTTPNSHVAILAESYGVPFAYLADETARQEALALDGRTVTLRTAGDFFGCAVSLLDAPTVPAAFADEILALKAPPELDIAAKATKGAIAVGDLSTVWPEDIRYIGGKAANFGFLRRAVPADSPDAIAFTFDLWDAYLDQSVGVRSLREEIAARLAPHSSWPAEIPALAAALDGVRDLIEDVADFSPAQRAAVLAELSGFDPAAKIRFRSSTNVEDSGAFVGAGLYDSFSGCVLDDTDGDDAGPSHCDPDQPEERGVFRAMRKVYASFYNLNAYLERLRHGVEEAQVGMALLVHHSFPDEIEAANGVATTGRRDFGTRVSLTGEMVSQLGAVSVTNPEGGAIPEVVSLSISRGSFGSQSANLQQRSSLLRLGEEAVMSWRDDYLAFGDMFFDLGEAFVAHFPANGEPRLEYEYKKLSDGSLVIKQMREVPAADHAAAPGVALVDAPTAWEVFQGEYGSAMGNHRLKSLWRVRGDNRWVDPATATSSLLASAEVELALDGSVATETGPPPLWPGYAFYVQTDTQGSDARDSWEWATGAGQTDMWLQLRLPDADGYAQDPIRSLGDLTPVIFGADYPVPVPIFWHGADPRTTQNDVVRLVPGHPDDPAQEGSLPQVRDHSQGGVTVRSEFFWPPAPTGPTAGYTAPLEKWDTTTISGLTAEPIVLRGYYSQTYRPAHHNFSEDFVFEPALEEGISAAQLAELEAADVRQIFFFANGGPGSKIKLIGLDGRVRDP